MSSKGSLAQYYRRTVEENDSRTAGWATIYYGVFSKVINDNNYKIVAEVGIGYGCHAKQVLRDTSIDTLYLVDPVKFYPNDGFAEDIMSCEPVVPGNQFNELYELILKELEPWETKVTFFRESSLDITSDQIPDGSLDCVFVDGDHSYAAVAKDLEFWWKKVRVGGRMLGDDYWMGDVSRAVNEFAHRNSLPVEFYTLPGSDYKIFSFLKV